ncbi:hypothetical protein [Pseudofrankia sp. BMG5.36]|uniref:hypothetical protein n=1 Tax=Pseudofrankia sp. BMG5.36 TaxID=1834512 RepID=UPI001F51D0D6|nr:hypothetical protein [Pseudofrankia sp. BMG5.36]
MKAYWFVIRKPRVVCDGGAVRMMLPGYFGGRAWAIPARHVAVQDLSATPPAEGAQEPQPVLARELAVPYLFTTGPMTRPNLLLMFTEPQRVPPLRLDAALAPNTDLPFGYRSTRSEKGARVDGVLLRADNPAALRQSVLTAGGSSLDDPVGWLYEHREVVADVMEQASLARRRRVGRCIQLAAMILFVATSIGVPRLVADDGPWWPVFLLLAVLAGLFGLGAFGRRLAR